MKSVEKLLEIGNARNKAVKERGELSNQTADINSKIKDVNAISDTLDKMIDLYTEEVISSMYKCILEINDEISEIRSEIENLKNCKCSCHSSEKYIATDDEESESFTKEMVEGM